MAEGETGSGGNNGSTDSITAFCYDTAHQLFGSVKQEIHLCGVI